MAAFSNKYSFCQHSHATPFCTQTNLRENRFFAARWAIGWKKGTHNVKIPAENETKKQLLRIYTSGKIALITSPMVYPSTLKRVGYWNFSKLILIPNWHLYYRVCVNRKPSFLAGDRGVCPYSPPLHSTFLPLSLLYPACKKWIFNFKSIQLYYITTLH